MDMYWKVADAMKDIMNGEFGKYIAYAIDYTIREHNSERHNVRKIGYADVILTALYRLLSEERPQVTKWDAADIIYWQQIVDSMKSEGSMLTE